MVTSGGARGDGAGDGAVAEIGAAVFDDEVAGDAAVVHQRRAAFDGDVGGEGVFDDERAAFDDGRAGVGVGPFEGEGPAAVFAQAAGAGDDAVEGRWSRSADGEIGRAEVHAGAGVVVGFEAGEGLEIDAGEIERRAVGEGDHGGGGQAVADAGAGVEPLLREIGVDVRLLLGGEGGVEHHDLAGLHAAVADGAVVADRVGVDVGGGEGGDADEAGGHVGEGAGNRRAVEPGRAVADVRGGVLGAPDGQARAGGVEMVVRAGGPEQEVLVGRFSHPEQRADVGYRRIPFASTFRWSWKMLRNRPATWPGRRAWCRSRATGGWRRWLGKRRSPRPLASFHWLMAPEARVCDEDLVASSQRAGRSVVARRRVPPLMVVLPT